MSLMSLLSLLSLLSFVVVVVVVAVVVVVVVVVDVVVVVVVVCCCCRCCCCCCHCTKHRVYVHINGGLIGTPGKQWPNTWDHSPCPLLFSLFLLFGCFCCFVVWLFGCLVVCLLLVVGCWLLVVGGWWWVWWWVWWVVCGCGCVGVWVCGCVGVCGWRGGGEEGENGNLSPLSLSFQFPHHQSPQHSRASHALVRQDALFVTVLETETVQSSVVIGVGATGESD